MNDYNYRTIKNNVISIMNETISHGDSIDGGLGRAEVEYWLGPLELESGGPPYISKLLAAVSIASLRYENSLEMNDLLSVVEFLAEKIFSSEEINISISFVELFLGDAGDALGCNIKNRIELVVAGNA